MSLTLDQVTLTVAGEPVIHETRLTLERGTMNVLLGPTLSGKTTLMRLMAGLDRPTSGRIRIGGSDVTGISVRRRSVAMVYQQFVNYPTLSVFDNIASPLLVAKRARTEIETRVLQAARLLRIDGLLGRAPAELSGGQQQRVAIARALVKGAELVLLDEPLANLDYKLREELREELPRLFAESGAILVYATTEPTEALLLGGKTITLFEGRICQEGPTALVYRRPQNLAAARVFSDPPLNELALHKRGGIATLANNKPLPVFAQLAGLPDGDYRLGFRANDVSLDAAPAVALSFAGKVSVTDISGSESFVHVDTGVGTWVCLLKGVHELQPGTAVEMHVDARRVFVFDADGNLAAAPTMAESA